MAGYDINHTIKRAVIIAIKPIAQHAYIFIPKGLTVITLNTARWFLSLALINLAFNAYADEIEVFSAVVTETHAHPPHVFTQGMVIHQGIMYESSGLYGKSQVLRYAFDKKSRNNRKEQLTDYTSQAVDWHLFAEGLTYFKGHLYLLSWQEQTLIVLNPDSFKEIKRLKYQGEGWGLTHNGQELIRSDGTHTLYFHDSENFEVTHTITVTEQGKPIKYLNELEYIEGLVWANIWYEQRIIGIDPTSGKVVAEADLAPIVKTLDLPSREQVLNGIAWDADEKQIWISGKLWPTSFSITLLPKSASQN